MKAQSAGCEQRTRSKLSICIDEQEIEEHEQSTVGVPPKQHEFREEQCHPDHGSNEERQCTAAESKSKNQMHTAE
jgi:hypothetical protein